MSDCKNAADSVCPCGTFVHPQVMFNSPGRDILAYRVGDYSSFRHALLQSFPGEVELSTTSDNVTSQIWRPSGQGDLAVQMVEWWAYLADILTFYTERAATQAYLRTADLPESVDRLVRLLGYRPRPGIGAKGMLAALANSPLPFTLRAGFAVQSKPGPGQQPQVFELNTDTAIGIMPTSPASLAASSGMVSVRPRRELDPPIGLNRKTIILSGTSSAVKAGDEVLVLPKDRTTSPGAFALAKINTVIHQKDPSIGPMTTIEVDWIFKTDGLINILNLQLYRGGQPMQVWQYPAGDGKVVRNEGTPPSVGLIDLASLARGIKDGDPILFNSPEAKVQLFTVKNITETVWYANPGPPVPPTAPVDPGQPQPKDSNIASIAIPHTTIRLTSPLDLASEPIITIAVQSRPMGSSEFTDRILATSIPSARPHAFAQSANLVHDTQANRPNLLVQHSWILVGDLISLPAPVVGDDSQPVVLEPSLDAVFPDVPAETQVLVEDSVGNGASGVINSEGKLVLDSPVPLLIPPLRAYFNLLSVSRGKTVAREVLGSGNAAISGQDFVLQNSPVTYLWSEESRSGDNYSSTVRVWVNDVEWTEIQSFFGQLSNAQVFVTHEDDQGKTHVIFGDGEFGARLPTGVNNIVASYRYGSGADIPGVGKLTVVLKPQPGLQSIRNPVAVGGGADPDPPAKLRRLAPRSVLTFNRAVSAEDYEAIAAQAPGVTRAKAALAFNPVEQRPRVTVWVGDDAGAVAAARTAITSAADPNRFPVVLLAKPVQVSLKVSLVIDRRRNDQLVLDAVRTALLDPDKGLLGVNALEIGQPIYDSQLYAACVAVPGVVAVKRLEFSSAGSSQQFGSTTVRARREVALSLQGSHNPKLSSSAIDKRIFMRRPSSSDACAEHRHDPGAGAFFLLPNEGLALLEEVQ
jgi:hypothetical protein